MEEILEGKVIPASLETYSLVRCTYETVKEESTTKKKKKRKYYSASLCY